MAKSEAIDPGAQYEVRVLEKYQVGPLKLRPGQKAVLLGAAVLDAGPKVTVLSKIGV